MCKDGSAGCDPRQRTKQSCNNCRHHKIKCDGKQPTCESCQTKGAPCIYSVAPFKVSKELTVRQIQESRIMHSRRSNSRILPPLKKFSAKSGGVLLSASQKVAEERQQTGTLHVQQNISDPSFYSPAQEPTASSSFILREQHNEAGIEFTSSISQYLSSCQNPIRHSDLYKNLFVCIAQQPTSSKNKVPRSTNFEKPDILEDFLSRGPAIYLPLISAFLQQTHAFYPVFLLSSAANLFELSSASISPSRYSYNEKTLMSIILGLGALRVQRCFPSEPVELFDKYRELFTAFSGQRIKEGLDYSDLTAIHCLIYKRYVCACKLS